MMITYCKSRICMLRHSTGDIPSQSISIVCLIGLGLHIFGKRMANRCCKEVLQDKLVSLFALHTVLASLKDYERECLYEVLQSSKCFEILFVKMYENVLIFLYFFSANTEKISHILAIPYRWGRLGAFNAAGQHKINVGKGEPSGAFQI